MKLTERDMKRLSYACSYREGMSASELLRLHKAQRERRRQRRKDKREQLGLTSHENYAHTCEQQAERAKAQAAQAQDAREHRRLTQRAQKCARQAEHARERARQEQLGATVVRPTLGDPVLDAIWEAHPEAALKQLRYWQRRGFCNNNQRKTSPAWLDHARQIACEIDPQFRFRGTVKKEKKKSHEVEKQVKPRPVKTQQQKSETFTVEYRTIRYRLRPTSKGRVDKLEELADASRSVWNYFLGELKEKYKKEGKIDYHFTSLSKSFTELRKEKAAEALQKMSSNIVRFKLQDLSYAYEKSARGTGGEPKFKRYDDRDRSFNLTHDKTFYVKEKGRVLNIQKAGDYRLCGPNRYPDVKRVSGTVREELGKWYAYLVYNVSVPQNTKQEDVGIDRNCGQVTCSDADGTRYDIPTGKDLGKCRLEDPEFDARLRGDKELEHLFRSYQKLEARKIRYQRVMSRRRGKNKKTGEPASHRYEIARHRFYKTCKKLAWIRHQWSHLVSRKLATQYGTVYIEDLNTKGMTAKGGSHKRGLNRSILASGWGSLEKKLEYKTKVVKVPSAYTSQKCSKCGHTEKENRKSQAVFECRKCGELLNADYNAALNILASGREASGRVGQSSNLISDTSSTLYFQVVPADLDSALPK